MTNGAKRQKRGRHRVGRMLTRWLKDATSPIPLMIIVIGIGVCAYLAERLRPAGSPGHTPYDSMIREAAARYMPPGWDWRIMKAMIQQESQFDPRARSHVGARGLCQIMPATAGDLGVDPEDLDDPAVSIDAAARYLRFLWDRWEGMEDIPPRWTRSRFTVAAYNAGPTTVSRAYDKIGRLDSWRAISPHLPEETQRHIDKVFEQYYPRLRRFHIGSAIGVHPADIPKAAGL